MIEIERNEAYLRMASRRCRNCGMESDNLTCYNIVNNLVSLCPNCTQHLIQTLRLGLKGVKL